MDVDVVSRLRRVLGRSGWVDQARDLADTVWQGATGEGERSLVIVGSPPYVPCHLAGHLGDGLRAARRREGPGLVPVLTMPHRVRHDCEEPHDLAQATWRRVAAAGPGQIVLVVAPGPVPSALLRVLAWAKGMEATLVSIDSGDPGLAELTDRRLVVRTATPRPTPDDVARAGRAGTDVPLPGPVGALPMHLAEHLFAHTLLHHGERRSLARRVLTGLRVA